MPVLSCDHLFITDLGDDTPALSILPQGGGFPSGAAALMIEWHARSNMFTSARVAALSRFTQLHNTASAELLELERKLTARI